MVTFAIDDDTIKADAQRFVAALERYQTETKRDMRSAVRSAVIDLVKSLRARTRKAPKVVPRPDVRWGDSNPKYLTSKDGRQFRRVVITRWYRGQKKNFVHWQEVKRRYRRRMGMRNGNYQGIVSASEATPAMLREARNRFGGVRQWGLAKKSWGWFMKSLFNKSLQDENPKAKIDSRMVDSEKIETKNSLAITIVNRLNYIKKAMPPGVLSIALNKAANSINKKIDQGLKSRRFGT